MFTPEQIRDRVRKQPFAPLRIVTSSGESYNVQHPDMIWIGLREIHVGMPSERKPQFYGRTSRIAIMHITALEDLPSRSRPKGDGRGRG